MDGTLTLKAARVNAGKTLEDVSAIMQVSVGTLSNWENNKTKIDAQMLFKLCNLYRVSRDTIFLPEISKAEKLFGKMRIPTEQFEK